MKFTVKLTRKVYRTYLNTFEAPDLETAKKMVDDGEVADGELVGDIIADEFDVEVKPLISTRDIIY